MELILVNKHYNGMKAKLGDVVYAWRDKESFTTPPPNEVVYVGKEAFVVEASSGGLTVYRKDTAGTHLFFMEKALVVNGVEVPAPLEKDPGEWQVVYVADAARPEWYSELTQKNQRARELAIARGLAHATAADAIAFAKAMVMGNPMASKSLDGPNEELF